MKLYTAVVYDQMRYNKEDNPCPKYFKGDNE